MTQFLIHNMAPLMFVGLFAFLLLGYPVAFALAANGIVFGLIGIELGLLSPSLFQALPERIWGVMSNDTLLAVPFFMRATRAWLPDVAHFTLPSAQPLKVFALCDSIESLSV